jgi:hypothetical protein
MLDVVEYIMLAVVERIEASCAHIRHVGVHQIARQRERQTPSRFRATYDPLRHKLVSVPASKAQEHKN